MATVANMGEIDTNDSGDETVKDVSNMNGEIDEAECDEIDSQNLSEKFVETQQMDIDENFEDAVTCNDDDVENVVDSSEEVDTMEKMEVHEIDSDDQDDETEIHEIEDTSDVEDDEDKRDSNSIENGLDEIEDQDIDSAVVEDSEEVVLLDDKDSDSNLDKDGLEILSEKGETIVLDDNKDSLENGNDSGDDIQISNENDVITLEDDNPKHISKRPIRRCSRRKTTNFTRSKSGNVRQEELSEESDIEEVLPEDPLAVSDEIHSISSSVQISKVPNTRKSTRSSGGSTIVVKDTKCLAEIASKSTNNNSKKEPTLVIIDTNSILSGRGPVPVSQKTSSSSPISSSFSMVPMALPAQGVYPANMRATITPIPMTSSVTTTKSSQPSTVQSSQPVLPTLSDDMFVVEAPSFIVPYVYEKPPVKDLHEFIKKLEKDIKEQNKKDKDDSSKEHSESKEDKDSSEKDKDAAEKENLIDLDSDEKSSDKVTNIDLSSSSSTVTDSKKSSSYFDSPLGKFFMGLGYSLVQESVQSDLLKQQKKRRDREGNQNPETVKTINSLLKNLEFTKENNEPFRMNTKKCEFCSFKTESVLVMAHHLETPHMKNYFYRCNFCTYEVRSPHEVLFHMEVQHGVRGRLERAPAFHQCPSCPFEDNQKGKLSRHLVSCARKFKPERNLEPPIDYEPPAKIPRAPRMKQQGLGNAAAVYQAMARNSQLQMMSKLSSGNLTSVQRQRGRPALGTTNVSGGSVLVPTNYQMSGNQLYQVVGGHELGGRLYPGGATAFVPSIAAPNSISIQQQLNAANKLKSSQQPSISITPLPRGSSTSSLSISKPGDSNSKTSFVICEICDGYIKDLEQLRNHMQWIHKVKIHPKMIYNRPPLNCQKCQFRFFTDQGLERHLLGSHGLVTSSMQEAANKSKDAGRCPVCGRVYQWKLLNHVARDHNMTLKPAHLSYKCTVCTATFGMYKQFESHVYSAHSVVAKKVMDKKNTSSSSSSNKTESVLKPLKINDEITIIPQPAKSTNGTFVGKEGSPSTSGTSFSVRNASGYSNGTPGTSKREGSASPSLINHSEHFAHKTLHNDN